ncbi:LysR family transcriptional regulator [Paenirhodobacter populi]|uniref:LysR family transcriptional regulator n=1 Tax=Paenirhodobacter populi TaxID=2306993 RepID=A0A443IR86_9RHOB|nr:LysR family transcriptional regulator [Sinirhodobacter populi]RWR09601.1 LysR family transcriptional regulator [Sinirhodobacter populi]
MKINSENLNINLRHLQVLQAIRAHGSFSRAAAELGVVPSALTETVRQLEEALGAPLFDRGQRPPAPTPLALSLLQDTAPLLAELDRAISRARAVAGLEAGFLAVGSAPSAITGLVGPALARFRAAHPGVRVRLRDDIAEHLAELVREGELDLAVAGRASVSSDITQTLLTRDRFGLACARTHRLAGRDTVNLADIAEGEVITLDHNTGTQQLLSAVPDLPPGLLESGLHADSTIAQLCMIRAGLGVGLLPHDAVALFGDPAIRFIPLGDLDLWRSLYLLEPVNRARSNVAEAFAAQLRRGVPRADAPPQTDIS